MPPSSVAVTTRFYLDTAAVGYRGMYTCACSLNLATLKHTEYLLTTPLFWLSCAPRVQGYDVPLVADIHFAPQIAMDVAEVFEKIRINPGNFVDGRKTFAEYVYDSKVRLSHWC